MSIIGWIERGHVDGIQDLAGKDWSNIMEQLDGCIRSGSSCTERDSIGELEGCCLASATLYIASLYLAPHE